MLAYHGQINVYAYILKYLYTYMIKCFWIGSSGTRVPGFGRCFPNPRPFNTTGPSRVVVLWFWSRTVYRLRAQRAPREGSSRVDGHPGMTFSWLQLGWLALADAKLITLLPYYLNEQMTLYTYYLITLYTYWTNDLIYLYTYVLIYLNASTTNDVACSNYSKYSICLYT